MEYNLDKVEFSLLYLDVSPFQEKQAELCVNAILNSRLQHYMKFQSYGTISFDEKDHKHQFPKITYLESFKRSKTNCIVFNLYYNFQNDGKYDKLIIYNTTNTQKNGYYGYVFHNSYTGHNLHRFLLDFAFDDVLYSLNRDFNEMLRSMIVNWYLNKAMAAKKFKKDSSVHIPNILDYNNMKEEYRKRVMIGFPDNDLVENHFPKDEENI